MIPGAPYALQAFPSASSFAGSQAIAVLAPATLYGIFPRSEGFGPAPMNPTPGFSMVPATPLPKSPFDGMSMRTCQSSVTTAVQYPVRSMGAMAFAVGGGPPPRACACTSAGVTRHAHTITKRCRISVDRLAHLAAPRFAVGRARDLNQAAVRAVRAPRWVDDDLDRVADPER